MEDMRIFGIALPPEGRCYGYSFPSMSKEWFQDLENQR
jgi:hypothetical protein